MTPELIRPFFSPIYKDSGCKEIENMIQLQDFILEKIIKKIEKCFQKWILSNSTNTVYAQKITHYIAVTYVQNTFQFMMAKKTPMSTTTIKETMETYLELKQDYLSVSLEQDVLKIQYRCNGDKDRFEIMEQYRPFLETYLPLCIPPYLTIQINNRFLETSTIQSLTESIRSYQTFTIKELSIYAGDKK